MLNIKYSGQFRKSFKHAAKQPSFEEDLFKFVVGELAAGHQLDEKYRDHPLHGRHSGIKGCRECHIKPDWLLVYKVYSKDLVLYLIDIGSHSDLF
ncbi:MAG: type II toxin-antitoxin system YafQ family toxin [Lachnospiraceae bacterium]|nr:type II toxin-antitoxin system YafQ family toxin [Lachnospiraceae bacterium]